MEAPSESKVDILKVIRNPHQVYVALLLVLEGLLGYWLHRAETGLERGFAGLLMTIIQLGVLYAVINTKRPKAAMSIKPPENKEATKTEIAAPSPDLVPGPDGSYLIKRPPKGWRVQVLTFSDWVSGNLDIRDPATKQRLDPAAGQSRDTLTCARAQHTSTIHDPGRTAINGRKFPSALETLIRPQLAVIPLERAQPPLFVERSLEENFLKVIGEFLNVAMTATHLELGLIQANGRRYVASELQQKIQDATVNGVEGRDAVVSVNAIGIQGDVRDYLLITRYAAVKEDPDADRNLGTLRDLVASFRPVETLDAAERRSESTTRANNNFQKVLTEKGQDIFWAELGVLLLRLQGVSLENAENRNWVMKRLRPFEILARETGLRDERLDPLWKALHCAETGDATSLKTMLIEMTQAAAGQEEDEEEPRQVEKAPPPLAPGSPS